MLGVGDFILGGLALSVLLNAILLWVLLYIQYKRVKTCCGLGNGAFSEGGIYVCRVSKVYHNASCHIVKEGRAVQLSPCKKCYPLEGSKAS